MHDSKILSYRFISNMKISIDGKNASPCQFNDIKYLELSRYLSCGCHHENLERRFINLTMISFTFCKTSIIQRHLLRFVITFGGCICFLLIYLYGTNTHVLLLGHATFCLCVRLIVVYCKENSSCCKTDYFSSDQHMHTFFALICSFHICH